MRSALPKVLHPICGRPMILWPLLAARAAGAERVIVVDNPKRMLREHLPEDVEVAIQREPRGTGDAVLAAADLIDRVRAGARRQRRHAADHGRGDRRAGRRPRPRPRRGDDRQHGARRPDRLRPRDPQRRRRRRARGRDQGRGRRDRARSSPSARSTPACTCSTAASCSPRWPSSTPTTPRASCTCRACCPSSRPRAGRPGASARRRRSRARRQRPRRPRPRHPPRPAAHPRGAPARRRDDRRPREHADRRHRRDRRGHDDPAIHVPARRDPDRRALRDRPAHHVVDCELGRRRHGPAVASRRRQRRRRRHDRPVRLPAPAGGAARARQGRHVRGDQELHDRRRREGPAPVLRRRCRRGRGGNLGAGTITANYDGRRKHRTTIGDRVRVSVDTSFVAPVTVGDDAYTAAGSVITDDVPPGALGVARQRQTNIEGYAERSAGRNRDGPNWGESPRAVGGGITLVRTVSALDPQPVAGSSINLEYGKRLMLFSGRANPALAAKIAGKLNVDLGGVIAQDVLQRRGLLPLRGVDPRRRRVHRPADLREPAGGREPERRADGADGDDRRGDRRLRAPRDRRHPVVRLQPPGQEVRAARADHRPARRPHARGRGRRPRAHDGPARRPDAGLLPEARRPHDGDVHPHPVLPRPAPRRHRRRLARRGPREAGEEVRREGRAPSWRSSTRSAPRSRSPRSPT